MSVYHVVDQAKFKIINSKRNLVKLENLQKCSKFEIQKLNFFGYKAQMSVTCDGLNKIVTLETGRLNNVIVAASTLNIGTEVSSSNAGYKKALIQKDYEQPNFQKRLAVTDTISKGEPLTTKNTKELSDVLKGENYKIKIEGSGFTLTKDITVLQDGNIGDIISISDGQERLATVYLENNKIKFKIIE